MIGADIPIQRALLDGMDRMMAKAREAWQKLYSKHGLQYGGSGDIVPLEPHLKPGMIVLDAGCGDGKTTEVLAKKCEVVGCDFSREALVSLRSQRDRESMVNLVECNIALLPFEHEKFDAVSCIHTLSHMPEKDRTRAAQELTRVLKPGGHLFIEGFGRADLRYGKGQEIEDSSFLRGNGILTHYFQEGEMPALFDGMALVSEVGTLKRVSFGAIAGRRDLRRALLRKTVRD
jgi:cyclopropane fatty-acyl-phospholipid synthase-like methyltransferase